MHDEKRLTILKDSKLLAESSYKAAYEKAPSLNKT